MTVLFDRSEPQLEPPPASPPGSSPPPAVPRRLRAEHGWLAGVTVVSFALNAWALSLNGLGNQYYAAASRSMAGSWRNFFFVSLDPGGFISVDKPPVQMWIEAGSARLFGVSSWSLLLPSAFAGAAAVAVLWCAMRRRFGVAAATVAALVLALSPINVAVNRLNMPEPFLILFLVSAAWAVSRSFDAARPLRWLVLAGALVGLAFNTKMLAAYIPVPALGLAVLVGTTGWWEKCTRGAVFALTTLACSVPWIIAVDLVPAADRPYVGGSTDNTVRNLVFGYNGFGRVTGGGQGGPGGAVAGGGAGAVGAAGAMGGAGGVFGGSPGPLRLFSDAVGGQIAWLLPLAVVGAALASWAFRRDRERRGAVALWAGWLALYAVVFSYAGGTFHSYYTSVLAPAIGALAGIGVAALLVLVRRRRGWLAVAGGALAVTAALQVGLARREPTFAAWAVSPAVGLVVVGLAALTMGALVRRRRVVLAAFAVGLTGLFVLPGAWALNETQHAVLNATLPQAGPRTGVAGSTFGSASSNGDPQLAAFLEAQHTSETWDLVVASAQTGSGLIADQGVSVLSIGGFMGTDNSISVASFADLVAAGQVRYVLVSGAMGVTAGGRGGPGGVGGPGGPGAPGGGGNAASRVLAAVQTRCVPATSTGAGATVPTAYRSSIHDCAGRADALRAVAT